MKRILVFLLLFCMILSGCSAFGERILEPVTFYYLQAEYNYGRDPSVIGSEEREAAGHRHDLSYLLSLYLIGPAREEHKSPLPPGTMILKPEHFGNTVSLELSNPSYSFTDVELTLACSCLALTCLDITDAEEVKISYQEQTIIMSRDNLTLTDNSKYSVSEDSQ